MWGSARSAAEKQIGDVPVGIGDDVGSAGIVATRYVTVAGPPHQLELESGDRIGPITIAYETYGTLNDRRDNAVLLAVSEAFRRRGIEMVSCVKYCKEHLAHEGLITETPVPRGAGGDV